MDIIIESPGFKASEQLQDFVREKVNKLDHQGRHIVRADVTLFEGPASDPASYHCEIRLEVSGNDHFVKKSGDTYERAIVDTVDTLQRQMQKAKDKFITRRHGAENTDIEPEDLEPDI
jgi:ribosomal subunit interface protein